MKVPRFRHLSPRVRILLGILSLALGVVGLILPILQGWLFIAIGVVLLSRDVPFFRKCVAMLEQRFPRFARILKDAVGRFSRER